MCSHDYEPPACVLATSPTCSDANPCQLLSGGEVTDATPVPACETPADSAHPFYDDGPPATLTDQDGHTRYACLFQPATPSPVPLVVFLHGGGGGAENLYGATSLRTQATSFDLSGDPDAPGFAVLSIQARYLHDPVLPETGAIHWDDRTWNLADNTDAQLVLDWVDALVAAGDVDPDRVYLVGWSEGGFLGQMLGFAHPEVFASVAVYSASSPYARSHDDGSTWVEIPEMPSLTTPLYGIVKACDAIGCDDAQADALDLPRTYVSVEHWQDQIRALAGVPAFSYLIVNGFGVEASTCSSDCDVLTAVANHITWPDGVNGFVDQEPALLQFLRDHPR